MLYIHIQDGTSRGCLWWSIWFFPGDLDLQLYAPLIYNIYKFEQKLFMRMKIIMKYTHNRVMKNFVCVPDPSVVTVPFATSKPRSFNAFICKSNITQLNLSIKAIMINHVKTLMINELVINYCINESTKTVTEAELDNSCRWIGILID